MRQHSSRDTGHHTTRQLDACALDVRELCFPLRPHRAENGLVRCLVDGELAYGVGDLFEQQRNEAGVESSQPFFAGQAGERGGQAGGEVALADETDPGRFERAEGDVSDDEQATEVMVAEEEEGAVKVDDEDVKMEEDS